MNRLDSLPESNRVPEPPTDRLTSAMKSRDLILHALFAVSAIGYFPFSEWISTTYVGTSFFVWGKLIYSGFFLMAVLGLPVLIVCISFKRTRRDILVWLLLSFLFIVCCITGGIFGHKTRMTGMESFTHRSQPLINAIKKYETDHSTPPSSLNDLVPDYLPSIPSTGMMAYPEFRYHVGAKAKAYRPGNPWVLTVNTFCWDQMLYFPNQDYPQRGYGGRLERVGDWAYVHE